MSGLITNYLGAGLASARPVTPSITSGGIALYLASDTGAFSVWGGSWATLAAGTVTSITGSGGTTGLTLGGGPITTSGTLTLSGTLAVANGGTGATTAGAALTNLGATTVGGNMVTLANPSAITFPRFNADNSVSALSASAFRTAIGAGTGSGGGDMLSTNNLSDVASIVASADNLFTKGTNIASASTTNLASATGNFVDVTGTTTITGLGTAAAGVERTVRFTGTLTLTYNATSLILPTAANITTAAGDVARFRSLGSGNWVCVEYQRASGQALASSGGGGTTVAFVGQPLFRGNNGTVVGANFFSGRALLMPSTGSITAIAVFCTAAQATAKLLPGVYTSDSSGNIATLLGTGPQVTGVTFGLNIIPLTTPVAVTAGDLVYVGCQLTVINTAFASMASNIDTVAFSSSSALPSTAGAGTYGTNGGGSFFAKMV